MSITPSSVNLDTIRSGVAQIQFTLSARITHPNGLSQIAKVEFSFTGQAIADQLADGILYDNGVPPDRIEGDSIYSAQFSIPVQNLQVGNYYCQVAAEDLHGYSSNTNMVPVAISRLNHPPVLTSLQAPDTVVIAGQSQQFKLMVKATDPDGQADIVKVFFNSYKPNGSPSGGNPFLMYDDGNENIVIPPNFTSGDAIKGDSIYTLTVFINPTDSQGNPTASGSYRFEFQVADRSNAVSQKIVHNIQVVQ